jgi:hypothetical protein
MGATRRNLQAGPKILKKNIETSHHNEHFPKKNYVLHLHLKCVKELKIRKGPTEFAGSSPNLKKLSKHQICQSK